MSETINLRTDKRMERFWREVSPWCEAFAELLDDDHPEMQHTKFMALFRHNRPGISEATLIREVEQRRSLAASIQRNGYNETSPIAVRFDSRDSKGKTLYVADGRGRACILLVLGLPIHGVLLDAWESKAFNPLERYPLKE